MFNWFKNWWPSKEQLFKQYPSLNNLHRYLHDYEGWQINRHTVSFGVAAGTFVAFLPIPFQMLLATLLAILFRANIIFAIAMTWISNPITMVPIIYLIYSVGDWVMGAHSKPIAFPEFSWRHLSDSITSFATWITHLSIPFFIGLPIVAFSAAVFAYLVVVIYWEVWAGQKKKS